jgi:hypothetical protein
MTKKLFILLSLIILISCIDRVRDPYIRTKELFGLEINKDVKVTKFEYKWGSFTGNGEDFIIFKISTNQIDDIQKQCMLQNFKKLPIKEELPDPGIYNYINKSDTLGLYKLLLDKDVDRNYTISVFDKSKNILLVYNVIM